MLGQCVALFDLTWLPVCGPYKTLVADQSLSPYVGNPETVARDAPSWWRTLAKWDWNSNDADMCCENWEPSGAVAEALASRKDGQQGWVIWAPSSQGKGVLAAQALASSQQPLDTVLQSYFTASPQFHRHRRDHDERMIRKGSPAIERMIDQYRN